MSSPIRKIFSSRSISSSSASRSAARNSFSGIGGLPFAGVEVAVEFVDFRVRAFVRKLDDLLDLLVPLRSNLLQLLLRGDPGFLHLLLETEHRIFVPPALLLLV